MFFTTDLATISHGIQLAVAPVFLLTAVSGMIGAVAGRLARIIDRARLLEDRIEAAPADNPMTVQYVELARLRKRGALVNACIALLTFCSILIGLTIVVLFLGETTELQIYRIATFCFLSGVLFFLVALLCFFAETLLATRILKFGHPRDL
ncbi:MAG: DUF2721 domain-containing protein [Rhodoferax sp.]|uniref:DUF2721 domain-containing protein n=1 Tax=Rhodoferax sp. TaxID=50421 RepID=UPI0013FED20C|nr:DUF2721 domain-containing protein [Rhodoferax sp.]NDP38764.1 DUF2721 domain-containing protein [Rhodoferax sp.]